MPETLPRIQVTDPNEDNLSHNLEQDELSQTAIRPKSSSSEGTISSSSSQSAQCYGTDSIVACEVAQALLQCDVPLVLCCRVSGSDMFCLYSEYQWRQEVTRQDATDLANTE